MLLSFFLVLACMQQQVVDLRAHSLIHQQPVPEWVKIISPKEETFPHFSQETGVQKLLIDTQINLETEETYTHYIYKVLDQSGVQKLSRFEIPIDLQFETLYFHKARVGNQTNGKTKPLGKYKKLNGRISVLFFLKNIHVGDQIELSFTKKGFNPLLQGHYSSAWDLSFNDRIEKIYYRIVRNKIRKVFFRSHQTTVEIKENGLGGNLVESIVEISPSLPMPEIDAPKWFDTKPWIQVTDFESWGEVAKWGAHLFDVDKRAMSPKIKTLLHSWEIEGSNDEEKIFKAFHFVQNEIGEEKNAINRRKPSHPEETFLSRSGDCNDKILLLKYLLEHLAFNCVAVLVNSDFKQKILDWSPTNGVFNHAILKVSVGDKKIWLDLYPNGLKNGNFGKSNSSGYLGITSDAPSNYRYGLELTRETKTLTQIPAIEKRLSVTVEPCIYKKEDSSRTSWISTSIKIAFLVCILTWGLLKRRKNKANRPLA